MKRILQITGKMDRAGAETMLMNLYRKINREHFQFDFITFSEKAGDYDKEIDALGGQIYRILETNPIKRMKALTKFLKNHPEYEIIHCHTLFSNAFHLWAGKKANVKYRIAHSHNTSNQSKSKWIAWPYQRISKVLINKFATDFISCGEAAGKFLFPYQKDVLMLPNAIEAKKYVEIGEKETGYIKDNFNSSGIQIIQVGRLANVKNPFFSIELMELLKNAAINFKFFFIGQGDLEEEIKERIKEKKLEDVVEVLGIRTDIPYLMAGADVMLMPSFHEGFPVVLVESQAVGLPAVISDNISEEVDLGLDLVKFLSLDNNLEEWKKAILEIKNKTTVSEKRLEHLQKNGFDVTENAKILEGIYDKMR